MNTLEKKIYTYEKNLNDFTKAINSNEVCMIDEEMFYYWLEVLPPIYMDKVVDVEIDGIKYQKRCSFGFAEGWENIIDFWANGQGLYWAKKSNRLNT